MNIAEILKYCPKGTKLYCTLCGNAELGEITNIGTIVIRKVVDTISTPYTLDYEGRYSHSGECVLFPSKDQRDWNKFRLPVKRGDIMMIKKDGKCPFIVNGKFYNGISPEYICGVDISSSFLTGNGGWTSEFYIPASEEAKKELFDKMAEAGYKWNADTLELEEIKPCFKEGDILVREEDSTLYLFTGVIINDIMQACCLLADGTAIDCGISISSLKLVSITERNKFYSALARDGYKYDKEQHTLVKQEFKPFEKVLVRDDTNKKWSIDLFSYYDEENKNFPYVCMHIHYCYCIPYEGNEYLLGTTDSPTCVDKKE